MAGEPPMSAEVARPAGARKRFRPELVPTLVMLVCLGILLALGNWQTGRYRQQTALVERYHAQHDVAPAVQAAAELAAGQDREARLQFRRVALRGTVDAAHVHWLTARYMLGQRGFGVLVPLVLADAPSAGPRALLVDLGWVPEGKEATLLRSLATEATSGKTRVVRGRLHVVPAALRAGIPGSDAPAGQHLQRPTWRAPNPTAIARTTPGLDPELLVLAGEQATGRTVDPAQVPLDGYAYPVRPLPMKNVEYAVTWYGLALTCVAVWFALSRREPAA
ncbi:MAG: SURF1 family protein [Myxococcales bacterium]|nr:SURF1 family protein [Myxococcales bacterium]